MGKHSNVSLLICQCNGMGRITDAEKVQEIERLLISSFTLYKYSKQFERASQDLGDIAIKLILKEGVDLETLLIEIKKKVEHDS